MTEEPEHLDTVITLPPGPLDPARARELLRLCLEDYRWLRPARISSGGDKPSKLPKGDLAAVLDLAAETLEGGGRVELTTAADREMLILAPDRHGRRTHIGHLTWSAPPDTMKDERRRSAHLGEVAELMRVAGSPYARAELDLDHDRKLKYWSADGTLVFRLKQLHEGLIGLYWRNFFGPPFEKLFGTRLDALPPDTVFKVGGTTVVQPYPLPEEALTPAGAERERELIAKLGAQAFYDHSREAPPSLRPELPPTDRPPGD